MAFCLTLLGVYALAPQGDAHAPALSEACPPRARTTAASVAPGARLASGETARGGIVACVGSRPIGGETFAHWARVARDSEGPAPKSRLTRAAVVKEVMGFLISGDWVIDEARALHVGVSAREVRRTFERIRKSEFHKQREFQAFLKRSGEDVADLMLRVKLNLLSQRIQKHVLAGHSGEASRRAALMRFVTAFKRRWKPRTYCTPQYAVADCGHVQRPPL
jgi:SurA N-terminal domain